jgi:hypothetical protein
MTRVMQQTSLFQLLQRTEPPSESTCALKEPAVLDSMMQRLWILHDFIQFFRVFRVANRTFGFYCSLVHDRRHHENPPNQVASQR